MLIARNSVVGEVGAIDVVAGANRAQETTIEDVRVIDNRLSLVGLGSGVTVQSGSEDPTHTIGPPVRYQDDNVIRDVVIRGNSITGDLNDGIGVFAGTFAGGRRNRVKNVRIIDNVVRSTYKSTIGLYVFSGSYDPYRDRYSADNRILGLVVKGNRIRFGSGDFPHDKGGVEDSGIVLLGGYVYARDNLVRDVRIARNSIRSAKIGIRLIGGFGPQAHKNRVFCVPLRGNSITGARKKVSVRSNERGATGNKARLGGC